MNVLSRVSFVFDEQKVLCFPPTHAHSPEIKRTGVVANSVLPS